MKQIPPHELATYQRSHAVRLADYDYRTSAVVHFTICAARETPFSESRIAQMVCESVEKSCELCKHQLFGFCVMPDHLHVLLDPQDSESSTSNWLRRFKSFTTNQFHKLGGHGDLWQRSAYDHDCRGDETAEKVLAYIIENPVRAGLVQRWEDWPWTKIFIKL